VSLCYVVTTKQKAQYKWNKFSCRVIITGFGQHCHVRFLSQAPLEIENMLLRNLTDMLLVLQRGFAFIHLHWLETWPQLLLDQKELAISSVNSLEICHATFAALCAFSEYNWRAVVAVSYHQLFLYHSDYFWLSCNYINLSAHLKSASSVASCQLSCNMSARCWLSAEGKLVHAASLFFAKEK